MTTNLKKEVIALIKKLPEEVTLDDIMYHLYVKKKILIGLQEVNQDKSIPHEEVMDNAKMRLEKWLK